MRLHRTAALAAAIVLGACNAGDDPTVEAGGDTATTGGTAVATSTSTPPTTGAVAPPVSAPAPAGAERAYLTDVRVAAAEVGGGSRVVFEFEPNLPAYRIDYIERPITEDGSGNEVAVAGEAVLEVRFDDASGARIEGEKVILTYKGPKRVPATGAGGVVTEAVDTGDFEGIVTWAVGLRKKTPTITVTTLAGPDRLVIDVPAPTT
ncbi:MAG: AMIN-like domain-containing (lipo)protein [Acidimicrobiales bacterium]